MRFMLFGGLVIVVYTVVAYARSFSAGCCGARIPGGLEFAFLVSLEVLVAALIVSLGTKLFEELWCGGCHRLDPMGQVSKVSSAAPSRSRTADRWSWTKRIYVRRF